MTAVLLAAPAAAQSRPEILRIPMTDRVPVLGDFLAEPRVAGALVRTEFRQRDPHDGDPSSEATTAYVSYDADHLYVGFVCRDRDPGRVRARLSKRDAIAQDDQVIVMLDTFHDHRRSYLFAVNPLGIQADALSSEGRDDDYSFDTVWKSSGGLRPDGYAVLIAIPFKSLRITAGAGGTWGIALARAIPRNSELSFWPHITRRVEGITQQFATVEQPARVSGGRNMQFIPYAAASSGRYLDHAVSRYGSVKEGRAGIDAKLVLRDAVAVDVALNPDFSQVESDQPQVAVNQRFELFYPEKRPFFLENASIFRYSRTASSDPTTRNIPEMLFFSRRIQNPRVGARVTGKAGHWAFGSVIADDRGVGAAAGNSAALVMVGRAQREFGGQSTIGVLVTSRDQGVDRNHVAAVDVRLKLSPNWVFSGQAIASATSAGVARRTGSAFNASLFYSSRRALYSAFYSDRSPDFRAALGFVPRVNIRQIEQYAEYRWRPRRGPVVAYGPNAYVRLNWNHDGQLQERIVRYPFQVDLKGRTQIFVRRVESFERFNGADLRGHIHTINVTTEWLKWLAVTEGVEWGVTPNYFPAEDGVPYMGESSNVSIALTFRPTPRLRYDATYLRAVLSTRAANGASSTRIFTNNIARSTLNYQFTRELSIRAIVDYNSVSPNTTRVRLTHDERIGVDTLFTYQVGPSAALYVGYTSGVQNVSPSDDGLPAHRIERPRTQVGRQVLFKLSWLIRH